MEQSQKVFIVIKVERHATWWSSVEW